MKGWDRLEHGWQAAFTQMWEAYCNGCTPIGAAICDAAGNVVCATRNSIDDENLNLTITHHQLAHAEANAILKLSECDHPDIRTYALYTTLEPCPFCFGAIVMGSIRRFSYAARDPIAGSACLSEASPYIRSKRIAVEGPIPELEAITYAIKSCHALEMPDGNGRQRRIDAFQSSFPKAFAAGEKLYAAGTLQKLRRDGGGIEAAYRVAVEALK